jgi:hypothetical protein
MRASTFLQSFEEGMQSSQDGRLWLTTLSGIIHRSLPDVRESLQDSERDLSLLPRTLQAVELLTFLTRQFEALRRAEITMLETLEFELSFSHVENSSADMATQGRNQ